MPETTEPPGGGQPDRPIRVLGIDGGGTRCTAVLAEVRTENVQELGRGQGGPANAVTAGFEAAAANVAAAVAGAFAASGLAAGPVASACLGFAGAGRDDVRRRWGRWADDRELAGLVEVVADGVPAFGGRGAPPWGLVVVSGTGSIVWGRRSDGRLERCGGRGGLIGDEGSGFAIAIAGLRAAMRSADGWGPRTGLLPRALERFGAAEPNELPAALAAAGMARGPIAAFAPDVVALAEDGDPEAARILAEASADLGRQALVIVERLGFPEAEYPLRFTGGLLCHAAPLRDGLTRWLAGAGRSPGSVTTVADLALAAAGMAADRVR
jgi:N-acetylmuramic acid 6-phosphate etherase